MIDSFANGLAKRLPEGVRAPLRGVWTRLRPGANTGRPPGEDEVVERLLRAVASADAPRIAVDIAACDGVTKSNTLALYRQGWGGLAVEGDVERFAQLARSYARFDRVSLARVWVRPDTVVDLLRSAGIPERFAFLNLDIDSYDHFVLEALLSEYRPSLVCAEINEKLPPPLRFTVRFDPEHVWRFDHFYGQSISKLHELAIARDYVLLELHYNNAFLAPAELGLPGLTPEDAYAAGYLSRPDRLELFPWNADMEELHRLPVEEQLAFVHRRFRDYEGLYELDA